MMSLSNYQFKLGSMAPYTEDSMFGFDLDFLNWWMVNPLGNPK